MGNNLNMRKLLVAEPPKKLSGFTGRAIKKRRVGTKVVLLPPRVCGVSPSQALQPSPLCASPMGTRTPLRTWARLFPAPPPPPPLKRVVLSVLNRQAFFFVRPIKTEGKVSQQVAALLHSGSSSLFCMKFSAMFYTPLDLNGTLEVGTTPPPGLTERARTHFCFPILRVFLWFFLQERTTETIIRG